VEKEEGPVVGLGSHTPLSASLAAQTDFAERAKYIPMRLGLEQRRLLRLLEAALNVSEYTDKVGRKL
jgi:hypothetical protein